MKQTRTIGIVIPDVESGYYSALVSRIDTLLRDEGYMVFLCNTFYDRTTERELIKALIEFNVDGIVVCYDLLDKNCYKDIERYRVPLVVIDFKMTGEYEEVPSVRTDNVLGSRFLIEHLRNLNVRKICVVSEPTWCITLEHRLNCFVDAIKEFGFSLEEDDIYVASHFYNKTNMGYDISHNILNHNLPDVICATTDNLAIGIMRRMNENGVNIPKDVLLTGFDDISQCLFVTPNLTTISQPIEIIASSSVGLLLDSISDKQPDERHIMLEPSLVVRGSTMKVYL